MPPPTTLKLKDVLHYDPDYDPHASASPFPITNGSPCPLTLVMTLEEFRAFWSQERLAYSWSHYYESMSTPYYNDKADIESLLPDRSRYLLHAENRPGPSPKFDWSLTHHCRHHREPVDITIGRQSVGQGCQVRIRMQKIIGKDQVKIVYHWQHNHDTSSVAMARMPCGANQRHWIRKQLRQGHTWVTLKNMLRPDEDLQRRIEDGEACPSGMMICYHHVRDALYRERMKRSQKSPDVVKSVEIWFKDITEKGGKTLFLPSHSDGFLFGWCSAFQLKLMEDNTDIVCMDSTHNTTKDIRPVPDAPKAFKKALLFTLVVKDRLIRKGIPVAFMISSSESQGFIRSWLTWLKDSCGLGARGFMIDLAKPESSAILSVFPKATIHYCDFHVAQLWEKHMRDSRSRKKSDEMRPLLLQVRRAQTSEEQKRLWVEFKEKYPTANKLVKYIEDKWFQEGVLQRWARYFREVDQEINTNNWIESWHKTLKMHHLRQERNVRADYLIYLLQGAVDLDFRVSYYKIANGYERIPLSAADKERRKRAEEVPFDDALASVDLRLEENKVLVRSFTIPDTMYTVNVEPPQGLPLDVPKGLLLSCTCPDYVKRKMPCKHMYLLERMYVYLRINKYLAPQVHEPRDDNHQGEPQGQDILEFPPIPETFPPQVKEHINAERVREQMNLKRKRQEERAEAFATCEREMIAHIQDLVKNVMNANRVCTLEYYQALLDDMRNVCRNARGLHTKGVGRTCQ